ncbi:hypothetical protein PR048_013222 [Dryococelus australis]|uniref:HAT C-terminal dimerisation domain-containing protein n=1 Tax=Dryococelus australis TaxID=614101 RepID=A0ABQ9HRJ2_9NEOP|nr:hypothetical protein PR048_013222 [Dryococelus australis]
MKEKEVLHFRQQCRTCIQFLVAKLLEWCPLKYPLTEISLVVLESLQSGVHRSKSLDILLNCNLLLPCTLQSTDLEYRCLISQDFVLEEMKVTPSTINLRKVVKLLLILSHGNVALERGFSVNGDILIENLKQNYVVAQCLVYDAMKNVGSLYSLDITK